MAYPNRRLHAVKTTDPWDDTLKRALLAIEKMDEDEAAYFVKRHTLKNKDRLNPSKNQLEMLKYIKHRGFLPMELAVSMNLAILGLLKSKYLVEECTVGGVFGIRATK